MVRHSITWSLKFRYLVFVAAIALMGFGIVQLRNMPVDIFTPKDWWGGAVADVRSGLHPTQTGCVKRSAGTSEG